MTNIVQYNGTGLVPRSELARMPQVVKGLTRTENLVLKASLSRAAREYSGQALAGELAGIIDWIARDIGYTIKSAEDKQYIVIRAAELMKRYYDSLTLDDFRLAFELAASGELAAYLPKDSRGQADIYHYQQFSAEYLCRILNAYKSYRLRALKRAETLGPQISRNLITDGERRENARRMRNDLLFCWLHLKYRGWMPSLSPIQEMRFYELLSDCGLAEPIQVSEAERKAILGETLIKYASAGLVGDLTRLKKEGTSAEELTGKAKLLARRNALRAALTWIIDNEIDLRQYV